MILQDELKKFKENLILQGKSPDYWSRIRELLYVLEAFDDEHITKFLMNMIQNKTHSTATINQYIVSINAFASFINIPIKLIKPLKVTNKMPIYMTLEFFENEFMPTVETVFESNKYKYRALFYFWFYTGMRGRDIANVERANINLETCEVKFLNKKSKMEQMAFFPKKIVPTLKDYFDREVERKGAFNIGLSGINRSIRVLKPHFTTMSLHAHIFRHSFATHWIRSGGDIRILQLLLGHKNIQTTLKYPICNTEMMSKAYSDKIK
jgi:site-specific recombinase XerD